MPKPIHIPDKNKVLRAIMEWLIDDFATVDILAKIVATWNLLETDALFLLAEARDRCARSDELQEEILSRRIEGLKKLKRGMGEAEKKTANGIAVLLNVDTRLLQLETTLRSIKDRRTAKAERKKKADVLNPKQTLFCLEYLRDKNGTQAATRAGYSEATAKEQGSRLLRTPHVKAYLEDLLEEQRREAEMDGAMALQELKALADWNIQDFLSEDNTIVDISTLPKTKTKAVMGIKSSETISKDGEIRRTVELKLVDKRAAWVDINRHFGNFEKDNAQRIPLPAAGARMDDEQFFTLLNKLNGAGQTTAAAV